MPLWPLPLFRITKAQQLAIKRKAEQVRSYNPTGFDADYRILRRKVQPMIGGDGAVILPWCNMWLAIETDGYTHS
jgi:hypothetical protein